ncbi:MAG: hypothetical protein ACM3L6_05420 [Deltaproteobacteria bacterium]
MKGSLCSAMAAFFGATVFLTAAGPAAADKIFLKNGKVYEGTVVGKSDRRYLFAVKAGDEQIRLSFFTDEVERVDMEKPTAERQMPYLQDVKKAEFGDKKEGAYEISLYNKEQKGAFDTTDWYTVDEIRDVLTEKEFAYYQAFNELVNRYAPSFVVIDTMFGDLSQATKEDFERARDSMGDLAGELGALSVPPAFRRPHEAYVNAAQATARVFEALEAGRLEEAGRLAQASQEGRIAAMNLFRQLVQGRRQVAEKPADASEGSVSNPDAKEGT